jgi:hypothetical protein
MTTGNQIKRNSLGFKILIGMFQIVILYLFIRSPLNRTHPAGLGFLCSGFLAGSLAGWIRFNSRGRWILGSIGLALMLAGCFLI